MLGIRSILYFKYIIYTQYIYEKYIVYSVSFTEPNLNLSIEFYSLSLSNERKIAIIIINKIEVSSPIIFWPGRLRSSPKVTKELLTFLVMRIFLKSSRLISFSLPTVCLKSCSSHSRLLLSKPVRFLKIVNDP